MEKKIAKSLIICILVFVVIFVAACVSLLFSDKIEKILGLSNGTKNLGEIKGADLQVYFVDVGQGNATLVVLPDGKIMLVDAGPDEKSDNLVNFLEDLGIKQIDYLVLSHSDEDHVGGMDEILKSFEIAKIFRPFILSTVESVFDPLIYYSSIISIAQVDTICYSKFIDLAYKEKYAGENAEIIVSHDELVITSTKMSKPFLIEFHNPQILSGFEGSPVNLMTDNGFFTSGYPTKFYSDVNSYSPIITISYLNNNVVLSADATSVTENEVLNSWDQTEKAYFSKVSLFQACHHGSSNSNSTNFLNQLSPQNVVVQCGYENIYGHPDKNFVSRLETVWLENQIKGALFRTDEQGTIAFGFDSSSDLIETKIYIFFSGSEQGWLEVWHISVGIVAVSAVLIFVPFITYIYRSKISKINKNKQKQI